MDDRTGPRTLASTRLARRRWLALASGLVLTLVGADEPGADAEAVRGRCREVGLKGVGVSETEHYAAVGDAPEAFRKGAVDLCEKLARSFETHFRGKGFEVALPKPRMTLVALAGRSSYEAFKGEEVAESEGGVYDVGANRLVVFDFRQKRENTFVLVHEAIHQLTYNTGLLTRGGDVPVALSEGFATYGELWQMGTPTFGRANAFRLDVLKHPPDGGVVWIPLRLLLTEDRLFDDPKTEQMAYAESWLLVYELLRTRAGTTKLQAYLKAIRGRKDPSKRVEDAENTLGNLDALDNQLKKAGNRLR